MTYEHMCALARSLMPDPTDSNPEYVRGMAELIALCFQDGSDTGSRAEVITGVIAGGLGYWNASLSVEDPSNYWVDDDTGEYVDARSNERMSAEEGRRRILEARQP